MDRGPGTGRKRTPEMGVMGGRWWDVPEDASCDILPATITKEERWRSASVAWTSSPGVNPQATAKTAGTGGACDGRKRESFVGVLEIAVID